MSAVSESLRPAVEELASSLRTAEISSEISNRLGELCFSVGDAADAGFFFDKALRLDSGNADAWNNLGVVRFQEGNFADAERNFLEAMRLDPGKKESAVNLSRLYACAGGLTESAGEGARFCPCCGGRFPSFIPGGVNLRPGARCPRCHSLERHRLIWLYLSRRTELSGGNLKLLHFAPETCIGNAVRKLPGLQYVSADLCSPLAMVKMDITDIRFPEDTFDVILCNHVLEHIPDDRKAMSEMYRVLKPGGWAILQVPIDLSRERTFEDPGVTSPADRERLFGQADHVRWYGRDYPERLRRAGFDVLVDRFAAELDEEEVERYGIVREDIHFCRKPVGGKP